MVLWHLIVFTAGASLIGLLVTLALNSLGLGVVPALGATRPLRLSLPQTAGLLAALGIVAIGAGLQLSTGVSRSRSRARHRALLDIIADASHPQLTVVPHQGVLVYTVPGRNPRIVATSGALERLSPTELEAVLAHEHGHIDGRHDLARFPFSALRKGFPRSKAIAATEAEINLLLELCADAEAVRRGYREPLLTAMDHFSPTADQACMLSGLRIRRERLLAAPFRRPATVAALYTAVITLSLTSLSLYVLPS
ncbi:M48 family metalloprotease [Kribbella sp. NPDC023855]|uniref:M56 family metallopeptidase n=1 Tax=Kribbella sp. NPDC023855 TaxID=3154698 RepID=UPI0033DA0BAD